MSQLDELLLLSVLILLHPMCANDTNAKSRGSLTIITSNKIAEAFPSTTLILMEYLETSTKFFFILVTQLIAKMKSYHFEIWEYKHKKVQWFWDNFYSFFGYVFLLSYVPKFCSFLWLRRALICRSFSHSFQICSLRGASYGVIWQRWNLCRCKCSSFSTRKSYC